MDMDIICCERMIAQRFSRWHFFRLFRSDVKSPLKTNWQTGAVQTKGIVWCINSRKLKLHIDTEINICLRLDYVIRHNRSACVSVCVFLRLPNDLLDQVIYAIISNRRWEIKLFHEPLFRFRVWRARASVSSHAQCLNPSAIIFRLVDRWQWPRVRITNESRCVSSDDPWWHSE